MMRKEDGVRGHGRGGRSRCRRGAVATGGEFVRSGEVRGWDVEERERIISDETRWHRAVGRHSGRSQVDIRIDTGKFIQTGS